MTPGLWTTVARAFRRTAVPLAAYYAVTLALPLANGAARSGKAFAEHALAVVVVPLSAIMLACAVHTIARATNARRGVRDGRPSTVVTESDPGTSSRRLA